MTRPLWFGNRSLMRTTTLRPVVRNVTRTRVPNCQLACAAVTYNPDTYRRLGLWWGVVPVKSEFAGTTDEMITKGEALLKTQGLIAKGDTVLMLAGQSHTAGATNMLRVHTIS